MRHRITVTRVILSLCIAISASSAYAGSSCLNEACESAGNARGGKWSLPESVPSTGPISAGKHANRPKANTPKAKHAAQTHIGATKKLVANPAAQKGAVAKAPAQQQATNQNQTAAASQVALLRSLMAAIDHANSTGEYSVLRKLGTAKFRDTVPDEKLAENFKTIRDQKLSFLGTLVQEPDVTTFSGSIENEEALRLKGSFPTQPLKVNFDVTYLLEDKVWRIAELNVAAAP